MIKLFMVLFAAALVVHIIIGVWDFFKEIWED